MKDTDARVPPAQPHTMDSRFVEVDGVHTHYFEGGAGPALVLLHSGEFGACAALSWEYNFAELSAAYHVIAPDWLGFGETDKVHDFENSLARRLRHMVRFLQVVGVDSAHFAGNSMGATFLLRDAASDAPHLPAESIVAISGGGAIPDNEARQALLAYDTTVESMRNVLRALFSAEVWATDEEYVGRRQHEALRPGAWECAAAARLRSPAAAARSDYGNEDTTPYERIEVPVLLVTGTEDRLKLPHYGRELTARMTEGELVEVAGAAHCAHIEQATTVNRSLLEFLDRVG